jgi:hypothetical protein
MLSVDQFHETLWAWSSWLVIATYELGSHCPFYHGEDTMQSRQVTCPKLQAVWHKRVHYLSVSLHLHKGSKMQRQQPEETLRQLAGDSGWAWLDIQMWCQRDSRSKTKQSWFLKRNIHVFFSSIGVWTQGFSLARQVHFHLSHLPTLFCSGWFWDKVFLFFKVSPDLDPTILCFQPLLLLGW